jgi:predicted deacetylase
MPVRRNHEVARHLLKTCESYKLNEAGWHLRSFADPEWKAAARSTSRAICRSDSGI